MLKFLALFFIFTTCAMADKPLQAVQKTTKTTENNTEDTRAIFIAQLRDAWIVPVSAEVKDGNDINVDIKVEMNPDATVRSATVIKTSHPMSNPYMKALADSALKAIHAASPLKLPPDRYESWKTLNVGFDPSGIL